MNGENRPVAAVQTDRLRGVVMKRRVYLGPLTYEFKRGSHRAVWWGRR
jgi:hypothetical protein